jgi:putative two-component system response regulator
MAATQSTILVVDDTPENLAVLGELLQPYYRVRAANSGTRALQIAGSQPPDLILLDVMMPEMDGYEVLSKLRASPATRDVPVIFVTAMDGVADEEHGLELGAVDYIATHPEEARRMGEKGRQIAEQTFNDERCAREIAEVIKSVTHK